MTTKKNSKAKKNTEEKNDKKSVLQKAAILQKNINMKNNDRMLEKVEKYVDENREKTSQEIAERKSKRPVKKFQEADLEVMISRISNESKPKEKTKEISKRILYIIYAIVFIAVMIFTVKYFFAGKMPQIS